MSFSASAHCLWQFRTPTTFTMLWEKLKSKKGEGMQLDQLVQSTSDSRDISSRIKPFELNSLKDPFQLKESIPVNLSLTDKGVPTISGKPKSESRDKDKKHKKHKDRDKDKDKEHKKHKHRHKDRSKDKDKDKEKKKKGRDGQHDSGVDPSKKHSEKKRKHERDEDLNGHKKVSTEAQSLMGWGQ